MTEPIKSLSNIELEILRKKAINLIVALHKNSVSLWEPKIGYTHECIVWEAANYETCDDEDAETIDVPGIRKEYTDLMQTLGISEEELTKLLK